MLPVSKECARWIVDFRLRIVDRRDERDGRSGETKKASTGRSLGTKN
jgi:hypothetical protein